MDKRNIKFNTACVYKENIYFSSNEVSGLLSLNPDNFETRYLTGYEKEPKKIASKNREIYEWKGLIFTFPYDGDSYEVYDIEKDKVIQSLPQEEGNVCFETCEVGRKFVFVLEYNLQHKFYSALIFDYEKQKAEKWVELSNLIMQAYGGEEVVPNFDVLAALDHVLIVGCNGTPFFFTIDFNNMRIERKKIGEKIHSLYANNNSLFILTMNMNIIKADLKQEQFIEKVYAPCKAEDELLTLHWFKGYLLALRCYDTLLYKIIFHDNSYELISLADRVSSDSKYRRPYLGRLEYGDTLFLLPYNNGKLSQYTFDEQRKTVAKREVGISVNEDQMKAYYKSGPFAKSIRVEDDTLGGCLKDFLRSIVESK